jgi:hypothetical protein
MAKGIFGNPWRTKGEIGKGSAEKLAGRRLGRAAPRLRRTEGAGNGRGAFKKTGGPMFGPPARFVSEDPREAAHLPIRLLAFLSVMARVGTVTVVGTEAAQSSRIDFAIAIASGPPVG